MLTSHWLTFQLLHFSHCPTVPCQAAKIADAIHNSAAGAKQKAETAAEWPASSPATSVPRGPPLLPQHQKQSNSAQNRPVGVFARVVTSSFADYVSFTLVFTNLVLMCVPYYGMPQESVRQIDLAVDAITYVFVVEMGMKLCALGWKTYWSELTAPYTARPLSDATDGMHARPTPSGPSLRDAGDEMNAVDGTIASISALEIVLTAISYEAQVTYYSLLTTHYSLLTTHYSLLTT